MSKCRFEFPGIYQAPPFEPWSFGPYPNCGGTWIMALSPSRIWSTPRVQPSMRFLPGWKAKGFPSPPFSRRVDQPEGVSFPSLPSMERVTIALYIFVLVTGGLPGALFVISTRTSVIFLVLLVKISMQTLKKGCRIIERAVQPLRWRKDDKVTESQGFPPE